LAPASIAPSRATSASRPTISPKSSTGRWRRCASCAIRPLSGRDERIGAGAHTDYGNLTLLATDDVGGLEVRTRAGKWIEAPAMPGAFVVNIGDCLMRWTNDVYVSTPHRVVNRSGRERYSIAFFFDPNPDAEVAVIPSCIGEGERARYEPILATDYLKYRLDASKAAGV
jgi:isopenicillin N synthase-like dioxygenase